MVRASYLRSSKADPKQGPTIAECVGDQNSYVLNLERGKMHMHELDADFLEKFIVAGFPGAETSLGASPMR